jgi:isoleucyl-tRNA synthetase
MHEVFMRLTAWLAPLTPFTMEEAWGTRYPESGSNCARMIPETPAAWQDSSEKTRWKAIERVLLVTNGALEIDRREKRIGTGLDAALTVHVTDEQIGFAFEGFDQQEIADIFRVSQVQLVQASPPADAFQMTEVLNVAAVVQPITDQPKCARSWRRVPDVGSDPAHPELSARDADAVRWWDRQRG